MEDVDPISIDLVTIVYFSHARRFFDDAALLELLRLSQRNNRRDEITGMLLYHDGNFVQVLEGPRDAVERTFARIRADSTHAGIISTGPLPLEARQFADWSMGFLAGASLPGTARQAVNMFLSGGRESGKIGASVAWALLLSFREGLAHIP